MRKYLYKNIIAVFQGGYYHAIYHTKEERFLLNTGFKTKQAAINDGKEQIDFLNNKKGVSI